MIEILSASAAGSGARVASRPDEDRPELLQRHHRQGRRVSRQKDRFGVAHVHTPSIALLFFLFLSCIFSKYDLFSCFVSNEC